MLPRLHEMSQKKIEAIPDNRDRDARAQPPNVIAPRQNYHGNVNECLQQMKKPKLWHYPGRYRQRHNEQRSSDRNPHARRRGPAGCSRVHSVKYGITSKADVR